jgi:hypothetical protein
MLQRIRDFGNTHRHLFSAPSAQQTFDAVNAAVEDLTATALLKLSASMSARADRKAAARRELIDLLQRVSQLARVLRARGRTQLVFELPVSRSDQALLTTARQVARDAASLEPDLSDHGMGPAVIAASAAAFETAVRDRGMSRADRIAAQTRIQVLLSSALLDVRRLDLMVQNELAGDHVVQAVWNQARRIEDARRSRVVSEPETPTPASSADPAAAA